MTQTKTPYCIHHFFERGAKDSGLIASQDIKCGTVIVEDTILMSISSAELNWSFDILQDAQCLERRYLEKYALVQQKYEEMCENDVKVFDALADNETQNDRHRDMHSQAMMLMSQQNRLCRWNLHQWDKVYSPLASDGSKSAAGIFGTNAIPLGEKWTQVVCPLISRFNHSCCPNAAWQCRPGKVGLGGGECSSSSSHFSNSTKSSGTTSSEEDENRKITVENSESESADTMTVIALRDISKGEEICVSYFESSRMGREARLEMCAKGFGFDCECEVCMQEGFQVIARYGGKKGLQKPEVLDKLPTREWEQVKTAINSSKRRKELEERYEKLERIIRSMETMEVVDAKKDAKLVELEELLTEGEKLLKRMYELYSEEKLFPNCALQTGWASQGLRLYMAGMDVLNLGVANLNTNNSILVGKNREEMIKKARHWAEEQVKWSIMWKGRDDKTVLDLEEWIRQN